MQKGFQFATQFQVARPLEHDRDAVAKRHLDRTAENFYVARLEQLPDGERTLGIERQQEFLLGDRGQRFL